MTAETVLTNVLLSVGLNEENAQISGSDYGIRQIRTFMNEAGEDVAKRAEWSRLYADWVIPGGASAADLPSDFGKLSERGAVRINKPGFHPVRVVVAPEQWEFLTARPSQQPHCHLSGGQLLFSPALPPDGAIVRYVSKRWVEGKETVTQNGDNLLIPERLVEKGTVWRWKRQKGLPYDDILAEFEADLVADIKADRGEA